MEAMSLDSLDTFLTTDPDDAETCEEHGHPVPCAICRLDYEEYAAECQREEQLGRDIVQTRLKWQKENP